MERSHQDRFRGLTFEGFRRLAKDPTLSAHEKVGFPDEYREGYEQAILQDVEAKLPALAESGRSIVDIGPGCGALAHALVEMCGQRRHRLLLVDSDEMLRQLPDHPHVEKIAARFPMDCMDFIDAYQGAIHSVVAYSVLHHVSTDGNCFEFVDQALKLLAPGGRLLIGDIPNISKRKRFFSSQAGISHHHQFTGTHETPEVRFNVLEQGHMDDAVVMAIVGRSRLAGFDAYLLPQRADLPMANRREDVLICRP